MNLQSVTECHERISFLPQFNQTHTRTRHSNRLWSFLPFAMLEGIRVSSTEYTLRILRVYRLSFHVQIIQSLLIKFRDWFLYQLR
jgi:hypothetical protein